MTPTRSEVLEALVALYLRLNGYFCIENYLQHRTAGFGLEAESDVVAVRMPHQREELPDGRIQQNDERLVLASSPPLIDCIIAEVKEAAVEFNKSMRGSSGSARIAQALQMFGVLPANTFEEGAAGWQAREELRERVTARDWPALPAVILPDAGLSVRMIVFAPLGVRGSKRRAFIDLEHVLRFVRERMLPSTTCSEYRRAAFSPWRGVAGVIVTALDAAAGSETYTLNNLISDTVGEMREREA